MFYHEVKLGTLYGIDTYEYYCTILTVHSHLLQSNSLPEPAVAKSRKKVHEILETLRAMTYNCTSGPALDALTVGLEALQLTFKEFLDASPEGLILLPHNDPYSRRNKHKHNDMETLAALPLAKSRDRSDYTYRGRYGMKADTAKLLSQQKSKAEHL